MKARGIYGDYVSLTRHPYDMGTGERIQAARKAVGWSQDRLAKEVGVTRPAVSQWEKFGGTVPTRENIRLLAYVLGVAERWLLEGDGAESRGQLMPVRGEVAAGVWREVTDLDLEPIPVAPHRAFPASAQYALLVRGSSLNKIAADSEYLHVVDVLKSGIHPQSGDLVVVQKHRHGATEATAKRLTIEDGKEVLRFESLNPKYQGLMDLTPTDAETEIVISAIVIGKYSAIGRGRT